MDKAKRAIEICSSLVIEEVRSLMCLARADRRTDLVESANWPRIKNFAISYRICGFDSRNFPVDIMNLNKECEIAKVLQAFIEGGADDSAINWGSKNLAMSLDTLSNCEPQPLLKSDSGYAIKADWAYLFDANNSRGIYHWLRNFFGVSLRLFSTVTLERAIQTGQPQWATAFGESVRSLFDLRNFKPDLFLSVMTGMHQANGSEYADVVSSAGPLENKLILDIGGATGALSRVLAYEVPTADIFIYEKGESLELIDGIVHDLQLETPPNLSYISGDFLKANPNHDGLWGLDSTQKFDLVVLGWILHDWQDGLCIEILSRAVQHLAPTGRLILLELPLSEARQGLATMLDMTMLLQTGGRERTLTEYENICAKAGLKLKRHVPTGRRRDIIIFERVV